MNRHSLNSMEQAGHGLQTTVAHVLGWLAAGMSPEEILADHPEFTEEDIRACLAYEGLATVAAKRTDIAALCGKYGVKRLRLFGSALRPDWDANASDLDFLAEFGPPPPGINLFDQQFGLQVDLERLLGRAVDVVDWAAAKKPHFRHSAEAGALEVYAA